MINLLPVWAPWILTLLGVPVHNPAARNNSWHRPNLASEDFGDFASLIVPFVSPSHRTVLSLQHSGDLHMNHFRLDTVRDVHTAVSISHLPFIYKPAQSGCSSQRPIATALAKSTQELRGVRAGGHVFTLYLYSPLSS